MLYIMDNIKNFPKTTDKYNGLDKLFTNIVEENIYDDGRDWNTDEINLFVTQFNNYQSEDEPLIDMAKLDPNFLLLSDFYKKFSGFDESVIKMLWECENKKLEDARIPPLIINQESVTLSNNLSNTIINESPEVCHSKTECHANSEDCIRGFETEKEKEKEKDQENC